MAICPECEFEIDIDELDVDKGDTLECDNCGTALEVVSLNPIILEGVVDDEDEDEDGLDKDEDEDEDEDDDED
jgi:alpha-aminoadipate carrier protein LysW